MTAEDILSIQEAVCAYGAGVDTGDARYFERCFLPEAELWLIGKRQTVAEYAAQCRKAHGLLTAMQHHCAPTLLDKAAAGDGSIGGRTPFVAYHFVAGQSEPIVIGGEYEDLFRPTLSGWRIAKRTGRARWSVGNSEILEALMS
jgi:hypothetical protein